MEYKPYRYKVIMAYIYYYYRFIVRWYCAEAQCENTTRILLLFSYRNIIRRHLQICYILYEHTLDYKYLDYITWWMYITFWTFLLCIWNTRAYTDCKSHRTLLHVLYLEHLGMSTSPLFTCNYTGFQSQRDVSSRY